MPQLVVGKVRASCALHTTASSTSSDGSTGSAEGDAQPAPAAGVRCCLTALGRGWLRCRRFAWLGTGRSSPFGHRHSIICDSEALVCACATAVWGAGCSGKLGVGVKTCSGP